MSVSVHVDGQPADHSPDYANVLASLGPLPQESNHLCEIWTRTPQREPSPHAVWINPDSPAAARNWLHRGGTALTCHIDSDLCTDRLHNHESDIRVQSHSETPIAPHLLAAFLAHDFPLVDALMLARAYRGQGWPYDLNHYPVPLDGPASANPFPPFPRRAGLYAVVPASEWVHRLADIRVPVVQLRDKRPDAALRSAAVEQAVRAVAGSGTLLFINDDWSAAICHGAYGVHLGQEDIAQADLDAIRSAGLRLGISTHGIYEILRAHACRPSYIALGAIYATTTKSMPTLPQGLRRLRHYVQLVSPHYPLVAIGGIDRSRIEGIWATGVDCAAVLRAIVDAADYRQAASELLATSPALVGASESS